MYSNLVTCLSDNGPGSLVTDRKYPLVQIDIICPNIFFESIGHFLGNKNDVMFFAAFEVMNNQFAVLKGVA